MTNTGGIREEYNLYSGIQGKGAVMKQSHGKQIVYRYNGNSSTEQTVSDRVGSMLTPSVGAILNRNGREWRVVIVRRDLDMRGPMSVPIHHVFLTNTA
jgi:hypothetical protein